MKGSKIQIENALAVKGMIKDFKVFYNKLITKHLKTAVKRSLQKIVSSDITLDNTIGFLPQLLEKTEFTHRF